jgi:hypothetical protein
LDFVSDLNFFLEFSFGISFWPAGGRLWLDLYYFGFGRRQLLEALPTKRWLLLLFFFGGLVDEDYFF